MDLIKTVIVSAYACDPYKGSEPGIGWNWSLEIARSNRKVLVITRLENKIKIEKGLQELEPIPNLHFYYYDIPKPFHLIEKTPFGVYSYYFLWQIGILPIARKLNKIHKPDIIHHLTFGVFRQPSFLFLLRKPFIFGPVGGAEVATPELLKSLPVKERMKEYLRVVANYVLRLSPILNLMYKSSFAIFSRTKDTSDFLANYLESKKNVRVDIGIRNVRKDVPLKSNKKLKFLYVGRFMGWKGVHLSIDAINKANQDNENVEFTIIGSGPFESELKQRVRCKSINFIDWVPQHELYLFYENYDCFLFPSFHDSGGTVILEAFSYGLPVICLNIGGPNEFVDNSCGIKIDVNGKSANQITDELSEIVLDLNTNKNKLESLKSGALRKAKFYNWESVVKSTYDVIENKLKKING